MSWRRTSIGGMSVPAKINIVTLGVADIERAAAFYSALGWERCASGGDEITWFRTSGAYLGLFSYASLAADADLPSEPRAPFGGITLAINVEAEHAVTVALDAAVTAGGTLLKAAERMDWGGFSGYFADPDGHPWEVAFNPFFPIGADGSITID
jgi:catechol 2,3-dioxygenase-like lactoylglutathione lyase family enzyme